MSDEIDLGFDEEDIDKAELKAIEAEEKFEADEKEARKAARIKKAEDKANGVVPPLKLRGYRQSPEAIATFIEKIKPGLANAKREKVSQNDPKQLMLRRLKTIWRNPQNKPTDIVAAANMYAELKGWKVKAGEKGTEKGVAKIEFVQDDIPKNKMITEVDTKDTKDTEDTKDAD
jgi:hypothetical protein